VATERRTGCDVFTSTDGDYYRGGWKNNLQDGHRVCVWPDGQVLTGAYAHGIREAKADDLVVLLVLRSKSKRDEIGLIWSSQN